jgi:hypothetical protein
LGLKNSGPEGFKKFDFYLNLNMLGIRATEDNVKYWMIVFGTLSLCLLLSAGEPAGELIECHENLPTHPGEANRFLLEF